MEEDSKISPEEYRIALDIVERYHRQIMEESKLVNMAALERHDIDISEFASAYVDKPHYKVRMQRILEEYMYRFGKTLIVDISKANFEKLRDAGSKTWTEFEAARDLYIKEIEKEE